MNPSEKLAEVVDTRWREHIAGRSRQAAWASWRASGMGEPCLRRLYLHRTQGEQAQPISYELGCIFNEGHLLEPVVKRVLSELGVEIIMAQADFPPNDYGLTGHMDGIVEYEGQRIVVDIKTINGRDFQRFNTMEDMLQSGNFAAKWPVQLWTYMLLGDIEHGAIIMFDKWGGRLKVVPIPMRLDMAQAVLDKCDALNAHMKAGTEPDYHSDFSICKRCPFFKSLCTPPMDFGEGAQVIDDEEVLADIARESELAPIAREYSAIHKRNRERFSEVETLPGMPANLLAGDFLVTVTKGRKSTKVWPEGVTPETVIDPYGRTTVKITPLEE